MPQPLSSFKKPKATVYIRPSAVGINPELAALALSVIGHSSRADAALAQLAATLSAGQVEAVVDYYVSRRGDSTKFAVLETLAVASLKPDRHAIFRDLLKLHSRAQDRRQPLAHWLWGSCNDLPDALLLLDPRDELRRAGKSKQAQTELIEAAKSGDIERIKAASAKTHPVPEDLHSKLMVYHAPDFEDIIRQISVVADLIMEFENVVNFDRMLPEQGEQIFQTLIHRPELQSLIEARLKS